MLFSGLFAFLGYLNVLPLEASVLIFATALGVYASGSLLQRGWRLQGAALLHLLIAVAGYIFLEIAEWLTARFSEAESWDFYFALLGDQLSLLFGVYLFVAFSNYLYWRHRSYLALELVAAALGFVYLLRGHRLYRLDAPSELSELAWQLEFFRNWGIEAQHILILTSFAFFALLFTYLALSFARPIFGTRPATEPREEVVRGNRRWGFTVAAAAAVAGLLLGSGYSLNQFYSSDLSRRSNGVGDSQGLGEGESNLGFNNAVTSTKQPSAVVRLESDYEDNPDAPMLYFREGALSRFDGRELTKASPAFDKDIPRTAAGTAFRSANSVAGPDSFTHTPMTQSVYFLREHGAPFAVGETIQVRPIKNPKPERFSKSYQAISLAPVVEMQQLQQSNVGSPSWSDAERKHYLSAPGDERYAALTDSLTSGIEEPVRKAESIIRYLSKNSIYTRSPGHEVDPQGDPVAPYLFAEKKRGYCVHFAHAAAFLFRLAGIPSRIGTGYQTDTTYAKDGHILLMMGDRHAWPEIFIEGVGWSIIDVAPADAENEPELIPDENLLEELMSDLDPTTEFLQSLPEEASAEKDSKSSLAQLLQNQLLKFVAAILLPLLIIVKLLYLNAYRFAFNADARMRLGLRSILLRLSDRGVTRQHSETSTELGRRLQGPQPGQDKRLGAGNRFPEEALRPFVARQYSDRAKALSVSEIERISESIVPVGETKIQRVGYFLRGLNPLSLFKVGSL